MTDDLQRYRITDNPSLTDNAEIYEVLSPVDGSFKHAEVYSIDVTGRDLTPILSYSQRGFPDVDQIFISLDVLIELGKIAALIKATS